MKSRVTHWVRFVGPGRVAGGAAGLVVLALVAAYMFVPSPPPAELSIPVATPGPALAPTTSVVPRPLVVRVHVAGAVRRPGVYTLRSSDRVVDAVKAAGGASSNADLDSINLAQTILDTEQIYVPRRAARARRPSPRLVPRRPASVAAATTVPVQGPPGPSATATSIPRVNINTATAVQLDSLPGVGPTTAKAIIAYRQSKGPFAKVDDLLNVPGIGPSKLDAMRGMIQT